MISLVVPNWNGVHLLHKCIDSLRRQTYDDLEIIVADGGSTDGSQEYVLDVQKTDPRVCLEDLGKNLGFVGNANRGLQKAMERKNCTLLALFNNDAEAEETWLEEIAGAAERSIGRDERVGVFASKVLYQSQGSSTPRIQSAGDYVQTNGFADSRGVREPDIGQFDRQEEVFSATGSAAVYRRELVEQIRLLEPKFESYLEDVEFGLRAHLFGWRCLYVPRARVRHRGNQTVHPGMAHYFVARNTMWLVFLGFPGSLIRRYWIRIVGTQLRVAWRAYRRKHEIGNLERIRGMYDGLRGLHTLRDQRNEIQRRRERGSDKELDKWLRWGDTQMVRRKKFDVENLPIYAR